MTPMLPSPFIQAVEFEPDLEALEREVRALLPSLEGALERAPAFLSSPRPQYLRIVETLAEYAR